MRPPTQTSTLRKTTGNKSEADRVFMGPLVKGSGLPPVALELNPKLEAALDRLLQSYWQSRGG